MSRKTGLAGAAGEYAVAWQLSERGWAATVLLANTPEIDLLAWHTETQAQVAIQVKATSPGTTAFRFSNAIETHSAATNAWIVLVELLGPAERPRFFVVPRGLITAGVYANARWYREMKQQRIGEPEGRLRNFYGFWVAEYEDAWRLLHHPAADAPYLGSDELRSWVLSHGRSEDATWVSREDS